MLGVIGAITGIVGAITGIIGMILSLKSLHQTQELKIQELRIERSRLINNTDVALIKAKKLLDLANQVKIYRFERQGIAKSSLAETWGKAYQDNKNVISSWERHQFEILSTAHFNKSSIEYQIQQFHLLEQKLNFIIDDLEKSIEGDKESKAA